MTDEDEVRAAVEDALANGNHGPEAEAQMRQFLDALASGEAVQADPQPTTSYAKAAEWDGVAAAEVTDDA